MKNWFEKEKFSPSKYSVRYVWSFDYAFIPKVLYPYYFRTFP